ncbi:MAG: flagellum-specific ATP synthase FliI, partial [Rhodocyclaceae bacterium]|nr:flagellum-specific ATP synthase FliI [Rhodocyclaceae bacterium]
MTQPHAEVWRDFLQDSRKLASASSPFQLYGRLTRINGLVMEAAGLKLPLGSGCRIMVPGSGAVEAEVVGFHGEKLYMMPTDDVFGLAPGALVLPVEPVQPQLQARERIEPRRRASDRAKHLPVGVELLGRVIDGAGRALDGKGAIKAKAVRSLQSRPTNPLQRAPIRQSMDVGIRAINALLTVGRGQRVGLFAGSGVGKSVLIGMMARFTAADVVVVGLVVQRVGEVKDFIAENLGEHGLARSVVVAAPADTNPLTRLE